MTQKVMKTENGQANIQCDMIFMLGGPWEACPIFVNAFVPHYFEQLLSLKSVCHLAVTIEKLRIRKVE